MLEKQQIITECQKVSKSSMEVLLLIQPFPVSVCLNT